MRKGFAALFVAFAMLVSPAMAAAVGKVAPVGSIASARNSPASTVRISRLL